MKKLFAIVLTVALLFSASSVFASVGYKKDGVDVGAAADINIVSGLSELSGSVVNLYANGYKSGVTTNVSSESNLTSAALAYGVIKKVCPDSTADVQVALANGTSGQMLTIIVTTAAAGAGDWIITDDGIAPGVFTMTKTGWDDIAMDTANEMVTLLYLDDTYGWIIVGISGAAVT